MKIELIPYEMLHILYNKRYKIDDTRLKFLTSAKMWFDHPQFCPSIPYLGIFVFFLMCSSKVLKEIFYRFQVVL